MGNPEVLHKAAWETCLTPVIPEPKKKDDPNPSRDVNLYGVPLWNGGYDSERVKKEWMRNLEVPNRTDEADHLFTFGPTGSPEVIAPRIGHCMGWLADLFQPRHDAALSNLGGERMLKCLRTRLAH